MIGVEHGALCHVNLVKGQAPFVLRVDGRAVQSIDYGGASIAELTDSQLYEIATGEFLKEIIRC
jgi:hypothetical protein